MYKILISLIQLCTALGLCRAQGLVGPGGKPMDPTTNVAEVVGGSKYATLQAAFNAISTDDKTIRLLYSPTLNTPTQLDVNHSTTLDFNTSTLSSPPNLTVTIQPGKVLTLAKGSLSGSLVWDGAGSLFAGVDMDLSGLTVTKGAVKLYRVLVKLPTNVTVQTPLYGGQSFATFRQNGDVLCCWLPQSLSAGPITFGDQNQKRYIVSDVTVPAHAVTALPAVENTEPDLKVAETTINGTTKEHKTLKEAFDEFKGVGGAMKLISNTSFSEAISIVEAITLNLNGKTLTAAQGASLKGSGTGSLWATNGRLGGVLTVEGDVVFDRTVLMPGVAVATPGGQSIYRTRLILPADAANKTRTYTYDSNTDVPISRTFTETAETTAYIWLAGQAIAKLFTLTLASGGVTETKSKSGVTIETNHDNVVNLVAGDMVAEVTGLTSGSPLQFPTFHGALEAVATETPVSSQRYTITLLSDVSLNGTIGHSHALSANQLTTINLNGHTLTGENCYFEANTTGSAYILTDSKSTGSITGTLLISGNIYIDRSIPASKMGNIINQATPGTLLYRLLATVDETPLADGFAQYKLDGGMEVDCYIKDKMACLFLPAGGSMHALNITPNGLNTYSATGIIIAASHSNVTIVRLPGKVARIVGGNDYATLGAALVAASAGSTIELLNHASLSSIQNISSKLTIDLKDFTLSMTGTSGWNVTGGNGLYIHSTTKSGTITGDFSVTEDVCIGASVAINGTVTKGGSTVYRTRFFLPNGTKAATYGYNSVANSAIIFPGEIRTPGNQVIGYAFIVPAGGVQNLSVAVSDPAAKSYDLTNIFIQAFHNNQFDMTAGGDLVQLGNQKYTLLSTALAAANQSGGGTITVLQSHTVSGMLPITTDIVIDLAGCTLNVTDDATFSVTGSKVLTIKDTDSQPGSLYGLLRMQGTLFVAPDVRIAGTVVYEGEALYRNIVTNIGTYEGTSSYKTGTADLTAAIQNGTGCFWLLPASTEQDLTITAGATDIYEATLLPALPNHNTKVKAYKQVKVTTDATWTNADNANTNVYLKAGVKLTLAITSGLDNFSLHRVTMENGAEIITNHSILATEGIVYRYSLGVANRWYPFSVPYNVRIIRRSVSGVQAEIQPYLADGTGGHFWLKSLSDKGDFNFMTEEKIQANVGYVMAVPTNLTTGQNAFIDFVSSANQFLNRTQMALPTIRKGQFYLAAPGTLQSVELGQSFYQLDADGKEFRLMTASATNKASILPFTSFLLADAQTMATYSRLAMDRFPTAVESMAVLSDPLRVTGGKGCIHVESTLETLLAIYTSGGKLVSLRRIPCGTTELSLPAGFYFVNRQKVIVR